MSLRLARYGFTDVGAAAALPGPAPEGLALWDEAEQAPAGPGDGDVLSALGAAADPYLALRQLHRVVEAARQAGIEDPIGAMRGDAALAAALAAVLGASI